MLDMAHVYLAVLVNAVDARSPSRICSYYELHSELFSSALSFSSLSLLIHLFNISILSLA